MLFFALKNTEAANPIPDIINAIHDVSVFLTSFLPAQLLYRLNTDIGLKTYDLVWQDWITPYASTATVVNGICIVSLCFEIKSPVGQFTNLGVVEVPGIKAKEYINTSLAAQGDGRCVDCLIDPGDEKAGYIYINARGLEFPANTVFRGQLVYPVWRTIVL